MSNENSLINPDNLNNDDLNYKADNPVSMRYSENNDAINDSKCINNNEFKLKCSDDIIDGNPDDIPDGISDDIPDDIAVDSKLIKNNNSKPISILNNLESQYKCMCIHNNKSLNKKWTKRIANKLRDYSFQATGFSWQTGVDAAYYNSMNTRINLIIGICTVLNGIGITSALIFLQDRDILWKMILFYSLSFISLLLTIFIGLLQIYQTSKNLMQKIVNFSVISSKFGELSRIINDQMDIPVEDRDDAITLQKFVSNRFNELDREKPFIRNSTSNEWDKYSKLMKVDVSRYDTIVELPEELKNDIDKTKLDKKKKNKISNNFFNKIYKGVFNTPHIDKYMNSRV